LGIAFGSTQPNPAHTGLRHRKGGFQARPDTDRASARTRDM